MRATKKEEVLEAVKRGLFVKDYEVLRDEVKKPEPKVVKKSPKADSLAETKEVEFLNVRTDRLDRLLKPVGRAFDPMLTLDEELKSHGMDDVREGTAYQVNRQSRRWSARSWRCAWFPCQRSFPS